MRGIPAEGEHCVQPELKGWKPDDSEGKTCCLHFKGRKEEFKRIKYFMKKCQAF
jgi:hypothetical protein